MQYSSEKKGPLDRLAEDAQLQGVVLTGNPGFDAQFHVETDNETSAKKYLDASEKQEAVKKLFEEGCKQIELGSGKVNAVWRFEMYKISGAAFILNSVPHLAALVNTGALRGPVLQDGSAYADANNFQRPATVRDVLGSISPRSVHPVDMVLIVIFSTAVVLASMPFMEAPIDRKGIFYYSLKYSFPVMPIFIVAGVLATRGKTWFKFCMVRVVLWSALLLPVAGYCAACLVNSRLDREPAVDHKTPVVSVQCGQKSSWIRFKSWNGSDTVSSSISKEYCESIKWKAEHMTAFVKVKPGRLGFEWIQEGKAKTVFSLPWPQ